MKSFTRHTMIISTLVIAAVALGNAGSTLYLPALIDIGRSLHASNGMLKLSLSCYLIMFGVSQLFYGPLSDAFGRRQLLLWGLLIFFIGSVVSTLAINTALLLTGRLIEGAGIGAANAVGYAVMRDIYEGDQLTKQLSYLSIFVGLMPVIAPLFGGYLVEYINWRACFATLGILALLLIVLKLFFLPETNKAPDDLAWHPQHAARNYGRLLASGAFVCFIFGTAFGFSLLLVQGAMLPFLMMNQLGFSASTYGWLIAIIGIGYLIGAFAGGRIASLIAQRNTVMLGAFIAIISNIVGIVLSFYYFNIYVLMIPSFFVLFGSGFIVPIGASGAIAPFPRAAGSAAALLGSTMFIVSSILTGISAHISENKQMPLFIYLLIISIAVLLLMCFVRSKRQVSLTLS